jgi:hypothetical protein
MIYTAPSGSGNSQDTQITGQGAVTLTPLTSGPYQGISIWEDRNSTVPLTLTGNGKFNIAGTVYAANAAVSASGNGDASLASQFISRTLNVGGNGGFNITWNQSQTGRERVIQLVE